MKTKKGLYEKIIDLDNLRLAHKNASRGKQYQFGVREFGLSLEANLFSLHLALKNKTYKTSAYSTFKIWEPKERDISRLPYIDRVVHHAIMNILEPTFVATFTADTYSCIKGKGIHGFHRSFKKALRDVPGTEYCLKIDIRKFYPSIDHGILKEQLRRKFKDQDLLWLLDGIIDSAPGVPIGNYLSQYFANFYLTGFDHWIKEEKRVKYYFRYADDIRILSSSKEYLHALLTEIKKYFREKLNLDVKSNYQVFPVDEQGVDVVGYVFFHTHILLRKSIKQSFARMVARKKTMPSIASYWGWAKHCNSNHLMKKLLNEAV